MKTSQEFETTDIVLLSAIMVLCPQIDFKIEKNGERATFIVPITANIASIVKKARLRTLKVEIYALNSQLRILKGRIRENIAVDNYNRMPEII